MEKSLILKEIFNEKKNIMVTGGSGFIGSCLIRKLLKDTNHLIFNLDVMNYSSDESSIKDFLKNKKSNFSERYKLLKVDLSNKLETKNAIKAANPDMIFHLAAESHVDRSIDDPSSFIYSNIVGTYNLLESALDHYEKLNIERSNSFRFHHISTDEVFGSLENDDLFNELTRYDPRSPYSASKASSDHLVNAWHHTYGLPTVMTNCTNNYGPWQFPEKLIPNVILKSITGEDIPLYGDGSNIRDWLFVDDHVDALLIAAFKGKVGSQYCIGSNQEKTNKEVIDLICETLDELIPKKESYKKQIKLVTDRPGHDNRYAIDPSFFVNSLEWKHKYSFSDGLRITINWYLENLEWCKFIMKASGYDGKRLGTRKKII
ncbi:MAG: dTDP-glucose 4,6-dehydratase [Pelagibacteraceae bacterium TMED124]|nr:MAG: dTDP-glucose 4,6-dehydratase [Pelagibacteraceae bacterium TMED124]|tara:strand:- start:1916 stop:3037 length:1122 start_codon:yes stop_codon:yes gene_type:complete